MLLLSILVKTELVLLAVAEVTVLLLLPYNSKQPLVCKATDFVLESRQLISIKMVRNRFSVEDDLFSAMTDGKTRDRFGQIRFTRHGPLGLLGIRVFSTDICEDWPAGPRQTLILLEKKGDRVA